VSERAPVSPCVGVCALDAVSHFCIGCARTIEEIAHWTRLDAEEKRRVIAQLPSRFARQRSRPAENGLKSR